MSCWFFEADQKKLTPRKKLKWIFLKESSAAVFAAARLTTGVAAV